MSEFVQRVWFRVYVLLVVGALGFGASQAMAGSSNPCPKGTEPGICPDLFACQQWCDQQHGKDQSTAHCSLEGKCCECKL